MMESDKRRNREECYFGVVPAFYTCYDETGELSETRCRALARHLCRSGIQGLYVGGSSGECIYLSVEERKRLLEAVCDEVGGEILTIAHVACNNTRDSCALARHAEACGVSAIAAIPPIYFRLPEEAIAAYWNAISAAAPHTDFFIYNIPQLAGVALTPNLYATMLRNPRVAGVKNSSMAPLDIQQFKAQDPTRVIWNGPDEQFVAGRLMGASGGIGGTYAVMPKLYLILDELIKRGKNDLAARLQTRVNALIVRMCSARGNMYAVAKAILSARTGTEFGSVREPLIPLQEEDRVLVSACVHEIETTEKEAEEWLK